MHRRNRAMALAAALGLLAIGARGAAADEVRILSGEEILSMIIGNTVDGQMGTTFTEYYRNDGVIKGMSGEGRYDGHWYIKDDMLCFEYDQPFGCRKIGLFGDSVSFITETGETDGTGRLLADNPDNL